MLAARMAAGEQRLDSIDQSGTRGVGAVQAQLSDLRGDVGGLLARMEAHEKGHITEARERIVGRRWLIGALIAFMAVLETPILYLVTRAH